MRPCTVQRHRYPSSPSSTPLLRKYAFPSASTSLRSSASKSMLMSRSRLMPVSRSGGRGAPGDAPDRSVARSDAVRSALAVPPFDPETGAPVVSSSSAPSKSSSKSSSTFAKARVPRRAEARERRAIPETKRGADETRDPRAEPAAQLAPPP